MSGTRAFLRNAHFDFDWHVGLSGVSVKRAEQGVIENAADKVNGG